MSTETTDFYGSEPERNKSESTRYGWGWIGELEVKQAQQGTRLRFEYVPSRPATSDMGNPLNISSYIRERRRVRALPENRVMRAAEKIVRVASQDVQEGIFNDIRSGAVNPQEFWQ